MTKPVLVFGLFCVVLAGCAKSEKVPSNALETVSAEREVPPIRESGSADPAPRADATSNQNTVR